MRSGIVLSIEALLSLAAAALFIGAMGYGAHDANYLRIYEYQLLQDVLGAGIRGGVLDAWAEGRISDADAGARIGRLLGSLGNFCMELEAGGKRMAVNCSPGNDAVVAHRTLVLRDGYAALRAKLSGR